MLSSTTLITLAGLVSYSAAGYVLQDDYESSSFFSKFDFFTDTDPTNGFVQYVDSSTAQSAGLINTNNGAIYIGVDSTNVASSAGRQSVRLTSTASYNHGLVILDLAHMPGGICGTWPAFWMVGPSWPSDGEIDIIEGVNTQSTNDMTLHTGSGCSITNNGGFSGSIVTEDCDVDAPGQSTNAGCQIASSDSATFGSAFNSNGGGVYAMEWTSSAINIYFFERGSIPADITSGSPTPSGWGSPAAQFQGGCDVDSFFKDQQIVFDTTFCGDWAGALWSSDSTCSALASTCQDYVQNNPTAFKDAYWQINSLKVYSSSDDGTSSSSSNSPAVSVGVSASIGLPVGAPASPAETPAATTTTLTSALPPTTIAVLTTTTAAAAAAPAAPVVAVANNPPPANPAVPPAAQQNPEPQAQGTNTEIITNALSEEEFPDPDGAQTTGVGEPESIHLKKNRRESSLPPLSRRSRRQHERHVKKHLTQNQNQNQKNFGRAAVAAAAAAGAAAVEMNGMS